MNSVIVNVSRIVGPALAGVLIATVGLSWAFLANAVSFARGDRRAATRCGPPTCTAGRRWPAPKDRSGPGCDYAWGAWELRVPLLMMAVIGTLAYNFSVILPLYAHDVFHRGAGTYSVADRGHGRRRPRRRADRGLPAATGLPAPGGRQPRLRRGILAVAVAPTLPLVIVLLVPMGGASLMFIATANSLLQLNSSAAMRGRVMALWAIVFLGSTPIGAPLIGFLAGTTARASLWRVGGVATVLVALWAGFALRRIRDTRAANLAALDGELPEGSLSRSR